MPLTPGQTLEGKYVISRFIAEGGMGEVYEGTNMRIEKRVAVKVLRREHAQNRALVERFEMEAKIAASIHSAHIADVYDMGELPSGERFIVMEYLEGETLADRLARVHSLGSEPMLDVTTQILDGLCAAHDAGIVHRDLKPENVFLTTRDRQDFVKLVDFGISKITADTLGRPQRAPTRDGALLGTPMYMSPEQARGSSKLIDHRTDIYALGVMMYEMTCGELPFAGENVNELLFRIALEDPEPLTTRRAGVDPSLAAIVHKAMSRDVSDRYASAEEMKNDLASWKAMFSSGMAADTVRGQMLSLSADSTNAQLLAVTLPARTTSDDVLEPAPRSVEIDVMGDIARQALLRDTDVAPRSVELDMHSLSGTPVTLTEAPPRRRRRSRATWLLAPAALIALSLAVPSARQRVSNAVLPMLPSATLATSIAADLNPMEALSSAASATAGAASAALPTVESAGSPSPSAKLDTQAVAPDVSPSSENPSATPIPEPAATSEVVVAKAAMSAPKPVVRKTIPAPAKPVDTRPADHHLADVPVGVEPSHPAMEEPGPDPRPDPFSTPHPVDVPAPKVEP